MANNIDVKDAASATQTVKSTDTAGVHTPHHNVDAVVPGTGATNLGKAEDAAHSSADTGVGILAVRTDTPTNRSGTDGDYEFLQITGGRLTTDAGAAISGSEMQVDVVAALPAGTNAIGKLAANSGVDIGDVDVTSVSLPSTVINGKTTVTTITASVALGATETVVSGLNIKAEANNTGIIYVGDSGVSSSNGYELAAGETVFLEIDDVATVYIIASVATEGVTYVGS